MTTVELAGKLIRSLESCRLRAYWDKLGKKWTVGYGHTRTAHDGMEITQAEADRLLAEDCAPLLALVADRPVLEGAALVSFGFNCGKGALQELLAGRIRISTYGRTAGGVAVADLAARRDLEGALVELSRQGGKAG